MGAVSLCPDRGELQEYLLGAVSDVRATALEKHLAECPSCLETVETLGAEDPFVCALREGASGADLQDVDSELLERLCNLPPTLPPTLTDPPFEVGNLLLPAVSADEIGCMGPYRVLRVLGAGGMGVVCLARHARLKRLVALKLLRVGRGATAERMARFRREAEVVARLTHPNIVSLFEAGEENDCPFLAMEYVDGVSLARRLAENLPGPRQAAELVETIARAMDFAHQQGVIHRDLKPANILLTASGVPKVSDFGLAKHFDDDPSSTTYETQSGAILGTPAYMAPEQASGSINTVGAASDIHALGVILYECLTGRPPFKAASALETLQLIREQDPVPPRRLQPHLPRDLQTICLKCLAKAPSGRYASAGELADDLRRFLDNRPIQARPAPWYERLIKAARRRPALATLGVMSVLAVVALVGGLAAHNESLQRAVDRAEAGEERARRQELRADAGYRKARTALQRMLARLKDGRMAETPRLKELQRQQLEDALAYYQGVLAELDRNDPAVRGDVAEAYEETAFLQMSLGRRAEAASNFEHAVQIWETLLKETPTEKWYRAHLANCLTGIPHSRYPVGKHPPEAENYYRQALQLRQELVDQEPRNPEWLKALAEAHNNLGVHWIDRDGARVAGEYQKAAEIWEKLFHDHPQEAAYARGGAETLNNLGVLYTFERKRELAETTFRRADALLRKLTPADAAKTENVLARANVDQSWGNFYRMNGQTREALERFARAQDHLEPILRQEPQLERARILLSNSYGARALTLMDARRFREAANAWGHLAEVSEQHRMSALLGKASCLVQAGSHRDAVSTAEALVARPGVPPDAYYNAACVLALASVAIGKDTTMAQSDRTMRSEQLAVRAMDLLIRAEMAGFFKDSGNRKALQEDPDLAGIRTRSDYKQLLSRISTGN